MTDKQNYVPATSSERITAPKPHKSFLVPAPPKPWATGDHSIAAAIEAASLRLSSRGIPYDPKKVGIEAA